ncbi:hypothetical protein [Enterobacter hormaechei]|uniref:hypothetical protein n=1 Tax=Enterobacter hormaechei TaxID=158836 RepID=UPI0026F027B7|nr:hypothetical protein [Enterobacter hormaechei]WLZ51994.1 hypothetical protein QPR65_22405 [Enterobacter hormaechei]
MKQWFMTFISDLKYLGREFRKEFLSAKVLEVDKNAPRGFDSSNDLVRPADMKNSNTILSFRR